MSGNKTTVNNQTVQIKGFVDGKRVSTQDLLQEIYTKLGEGYTDFEVEAMGQHNIGGSMWSKEGNSLTFKVSNPGQRVGSMGMEGTTVIVDGPAPADVGWLNSGAEIIVNGDGGDTVAHCAASGKIFVAGRTGTRSGALMKHDPKFPAPEFWVLKNTGSFSFEFMGGGTAVICGYECEDLESVLGNRSCVGMVGGTVYVRGTVKNLSNDVWMLDLDDKDRDFLLRGVALFAEKISKPEMLSILSDFSKWKKIVPKTLAERKAKSLMPIRQFRTTKWVEGGIFGDLIQEDYKVTSFVEKDEFRLNVPEWRNAAYSAPCEYNCPIAIPTQKRIALLREGKTKEALKLVLDYSPFPASVCGQVCPNLCMDDCNRQNVDDAVKVKELGLLSKAIKAPEVKVELDKKVAIIGSGAAGLGTAWHLRKLGYQVDVLEQDSVIGGKLRQVIPAERLDREALEAEIQRIVDFGVNIQTNCNVDKAKFEQLKKDYNAVVIAVGAHNPVILPVEGNERLVKGLDFLKEINKGNSPKVGEKVVVIGAGNAGMDVVMGAYEMGAKEVTAIDIQKPAAFQKEIDHAEKLGAKIMWPCFTDKITDKGVVLKDGKLLEADTVIISVGDRPVLSFLSDEYTDERGRVKVNKYLQAEADEKVFVPGDVVKLGLFTHAIGDGRKTAINIHNLLSERPLDAFEKAPMIPQDRVKKEYYYPMNTQSVSAMETEEETKRCMSCGYCRDCEFCKEACPEQAISRVTNTDGKFEYVSNNSKCIGCGICAGVCPCGVWTMSDNLEK